MARGMIGFDPLPAPEDGYRTIWSLDSGWGTFAMAPGRLVLTVLAGALTPWRACAFPPPARMRSPARRCTASRRHPPAPNRRLRPGWRFATRAGARSPSPRPWQLAPARN